MDLTGLKRRIRQAPQEDTAALIAEVREALDHHRRHAADPEAEYQLLWLLLPLARRSGKLPDLRLELERALDLAGGRPEHVLALASLRAELEMQEGRYRDAESTLRRTLEEAGDAGDERKGALLLKLGRVLVHQERYANAESLLRDVLPVFEDGGHASLAATGRFLLGNLALRQGRFDAAADHHRQALAVRKGLAGGGLGHTEGHPVCASLSALGAVALAAGNYPEALHWLRQAEGEARRAGELADLAYAEYGLGRALGRLGDHAAAAGKLRSSLELRRQIGDREGQALSQLAVAENTLQLGQPRPALAEAQEAVFHLSLLSPSGTVGDAQRLLGRIYLAQRRENEARRHFREAVALHRKHHDPAAVAFDHACLLRLALEWPVREEMEPLVEAVAGFLETHPYPDMGERLDFVLFRTLDGLAGRGQAGGRIDERREYLERAFRVLMRKTNFLDPELRHRFLFQVPDNDAILRAATEHGLTDSRLGPN
jgi:tetratricopeptide (TPR) repeat protein